jgi:hypothetical protein
MSDQPASRPGAVVVGGVGEGLGLALAGQIAETDYQIHRQHRSVWTMETEVRPYSETF